ncbi:hypothetical protein [Paenibacillus sedimenti]|uniref:Uncharacterized protein n=1 Tax=Paenibacillus sedimenti TaxID=2770274 RepID=A0A926KML5_9BACL|nr:hypothetical protein [Paenibacillus sedimenti]MBD0379771.1 hypothetical protein [Paenibacillus sedimenti]
MVAAESKEQRYVNRSQPRMKGFIQLATLKGQNVNSKLAPIELLSMDRYGIRFISQLKLPVSQDVVWRFQYQENDPIAAEGILTNGYSGAYGNEYEARWLDVGKAGSSLLESILLNGQLHYILFQALQSYVCQESPAKLHTIDLFG